MATLKEKIGYALGDAAAGGITWKVMSIAFPLFFTNVFGLTVADTATLMLIARMFDVVTDPLMGSLADRTQSRWGTYRPWLIWGAVPFGLIFALLLYTPECGLVGKRIWASRILLRKSTVKHMKHALKYIAEEYRDNVITYDRAMQTIISYMGLLSHCNGEGLKAWIFDNISLTHEDSFGGWNGEYEQIAA